MFVIVYDGVPPLPRLHPAAPTMPPYWAPNSTGARLTNLFLILTSQFLITKIISFALRVLSVGPDGAPGPFLFGDRGLRCWRSSTPRLRSVALPGFEFRSLSLSVFGGDEAKFSPAARAKSG